jgi:hypothetical protein
MSRCRSSKESKKIGGHLYLARAVWTSANADRWDRESFGDECGKFGWDEFNDDRGGASRLQRERVGEEPCRRRWLLPLGACTILLQRRLRREADMSNDRDATIDECSNDRRHLSAALKLHGASASVAQEGTRVCGCGGDIHV